MTISTRFPGRWTRISWDNPEPIAFCDNSGMLGMHTDLVKQMEYVGTGLVWTGKYVLPRFADVPNPQNLTPILTADPEPVIPARPEGNHPAAYPPSTPPF